MRRPDGKLWRPAMKAEQSEEKRQGVSARECERRLGGSGDDHSDQVGLSRWSPATSTPVYGWTWAAGAATKWLSRITANWSKFLFAMIYDIYFFQGKLLYKNFDL